MQLRSFAFICICMLPIRDLLYRQLNEYMRKNVILILYFAHTNISHTNRFVFGYLCVHSIHLYTLIYYITMSV